ncbi:hypothetical protein IFR09_11100 [Pseudomonas syringae]|nr:hypothetical protein [Pseudomonas syringae]MBD8801939.1 hypothetical protein [Pseudomonas syringae]MBD8811711.1 hypothetical protein [Pseudomonas syringae]
MGKKLILTGKAVVGFRKVMEDVPDWEAEQLQESNDLREAQIEDDDLTDIEWIHDEVSIEVTP